MMNNLGSLISMARNGGDPISMIRQMAGQNPMMAQAMKIIDGKSPAQLQEIATNMAAARGTTVEAIARDLGLM